MKQPIKASVYATNRWDRIIAPNAPSKGDPKASVIRHAEGDLRVKNAKGRK